jgi:hypothetical protein
MFAGVDDQGVEFVVERGIGRKLALEELADVFVAEAAAFAVADEVELVAVAF